MAHLSTKLFKIISKFKHASKDGSYDKMERAREKLDAFNDVLDDAYAYCEKQKHMGKKRRSCSNMKRLGRLQSACEALREKYEDELESESSESDDDDDVATVLNP